MVSTPVIHSHMDYYLFTNPKGMEGWVGVGDPLQKLYPQSGHMSTIDYYYYYYYYCYYRSGENQGKSASQKPTS